MNYSFKYQRNRNKGLAPTEVQDLTFKKDVPANNPELY